MESLPQLPTLPEVPNFTNDVVHENETLKAEIEKLKIDLDKAYTRERKDMDEIDELKLENAYLARKNNELYDDRTLLRNILTDLRTVISRQNDELHMWHDCYKSSLNNHEKEVVVEEGGDTMVLPEGARLEGGTIVYPDGSF